MFNFNFESRTEIKKPSSLSQQQSSYNTQRVYSDVLFVTNELMEGERTAKTLVSCSYCNSLQAFLFYIKNYIKTFEVRKLTRKIYLLKILSNEYYTRLFSKIKKMLKFLTPSLSFRCALLKATLTVNEKLNKTVFLKTNRSGCKWLQKSKSGWDLDHKWM